MRYFASFTFVIALSICNCHLKKAVSVTLHSKPRPVGEILADICAIEHERWKAESDIYYFNNAAMDEYASLTRDPAELLAFLHLSQGPCRGALVQLFVRTHLAALQQGWPEWQGEFGELDRLALLKALPEGPALDFWLTVALDPSQSLKLRTSAIPLLSRLPASERLIWQKRLLDQEDAVELLADLLLTIDFKNHPELLTPTIAKRALKDESLNMRTLQQLGTCASQPCIEAVQSYYGESPEISDFAHALVERMAPGTPLEKKAVLSLHKAVPLTDPMPAQAEIDAFYNALRRFSITSLLAFYQSNFPMDSVRKDGQPLFPWLGKHLYLPKSQKEALELGYEIHLGESSLSVVIRMLEQLREWQLNPNEADQEGYTALHWAVTRNNPVLVRALLLAGLDPTIRNIQGESARDLAILLGHDEVIRAFMP